MSILGALVLLAMFIGAAAAPGEPAALEERRATPLILQHELVLAIKAAQNDKSKLDRDRQAAIEDAVEAVIVKSGADPGTAISALDALPGEYQHDPQARAALAQVKEHIVAAMKTGAGSAGTIAKEAPAAGPTIIFSAPPAPSNGSSDYHPG